jgi:hypothetical protein
LILSWRMTLALPESKASISGLVLAVLNPL